MREEPFRLPAATLILSHCATQSKSPMRAVLTALTGPRLRRRRGPCPDDARPARRRTAPPRVGRPPAPSEEPAANQCLDELPGHVGGGTHMSKRNGPRLPARRRPPAELEREVARQAGPSSSDRQCVRRAAIFCAQRQTSAKLWPPSEPRPARGCQMSGVQTMTFTSQERCPRRVALEPDRSQWQEDRHIRRGLQGQEGLPARHRSGEEGERRQGRRRGAALSRRRRHSRPRLRSRGPELSAAQNW